jgi:hypothetical protein
MKASRIFLVIFLSGIFWLVIAQFFFCTRFQFKQEASAFKGNIIYNPYANINAANWEKCNFHAHANAWNGLTNGSGSAADIHRVYDSLNYGVHCVSNYHQIDIVDAAQQNYVSAYEHGFNLMKTHQLVLGGREVEWLEYLFPQTANNKQDILNYLSLDTNSLVILNHPALRNGYSDKELSSLTNFNCMEVLSPYGISEKQWDIVLSAGKPVFVVGNDDMHDIYNKEQVGRMATILNLKNTNQPSVLSALKKGEGYGIVLGKTQDPFQLPELKHLLVKENKLDLQLSEKAKSIDFIGQNGKLLASFTDSKNAQYELKTSDCYARAKITFENGTQIYLNPVFFTNTTNFAQVQNPVNYLETIIFKVIGTLLYAAWLLWAWSFINVGRSSKSRRYQMPTFPDNTFPEFN